MCISTQPGIYCVNERESSDIIVYTIYFNSEILEIKKNLRRTYISAFMFLKLLLS